MSLLAIFMLSFEFYWPQSPELHHGKVTRVLDGNTIEVVAEDPEDTSTYVLNLFGIDCPEPGQPFSRDAKRVVEETLKGKMVDVIIKGKDRLGVRQAVVVPENGSDPRIKLVSEGLAWILDKTRTTEKHSLQELEALRTLAQAEGKGIWQDNDPTPPWVFRQQQSMVLPKFR